jgi:branched-chain amino acid transport system permease protein
MIQFIINGVCMGSIYVLLALGFGLIFFASRTFHIAHGAIYMIAGYVCYTCSIILHIPLLISILISVCVGVILGIFVEFAVYQPLRASCQKHADSATVLMISSLAVYVVLINIVALCFGADNKVIHSLPAKTIQIIGNSFITSTQLAQITCGLVVLIVLYLFLRGTLLGQSIVALAEDPELLEITGYKIKPLQIYIFCAGSTLAALAGVLIALDSGIDPYVGFDAVLCAATATILGGMGRFMAPAAGAMVLGLLQSMVVWLTSSRWQSAVVFVVLILAVMVRPQGVRFYTKRAEEL